MNLPSGLRPPAGRKPADPGSGSPVAEASGPGEQPAPASRRRRADSEPKHQGPLIGGFGPPLRHETTCSCRSQPVRRRSQEAAVHQVDRARQSVPPRRFTLAAWRTIVSRRPARTSGLRKQFWPEAAQRLRRALPPGTTGRLATQGSDRATGAGTAPRTRRHQPGAGEVARPFPTAMAGPCTPTGPASSGRERNASTWASRLVAISHAWLFDNCAIPRCPTNFSTRRRARHHLPRSGGLR